MLILFEPLLCLLVGFPVQSGPEVRLLYRRQVIVVRTLREGEQKVIRGHSPAVFSSQRAGGATASIHSDTHRDKRPHNNRCRLVFLWRGHPRCWPPEPRGSPSPWQQPEIAEDTDVQLQLILGFITELDVIYKQFIGSFLPAAGRLGNITPPADVTQQTYDWSPFSNNKPTGILRTRVSPANCLISSRATAPSTEHVFLFLLNIPTVHVFHVIR